MRNELYEARGILTFTNILPPDIVERASTTAVHTFGLILSDNHIGQGCTCLEDEDSSRLSFFRLPITSSTCQFNVSTFEIYSDKLLTASFAVILDHLAIKGSGNDPCSRKSRVSLNISSNLWLLERE
jgi:hypothetical protein